MRKEETKRVLAEMLTEQVAKSFLDSGGSPKYDGSGKYCGSSRGYGRNYERQAGKTVGDFEKEQESVVDFRRGQIDVTHNVFHWLAYNLDFDAERDKEFQDWAELPENADESWGGIIEGYLVKLKAEAEEKGEEGLAGIYGDGEPITVNTYDGKDLLSQIVMFTYWADSAGTWVLLRVHGGCDARGGYTRPRLFAVDEGCSELGVFNNARGVIACDSCKVGDDQEPRWYTDNGSGWSSDSCKEPNLEDIETLELSNELAAIATKRYENMLSTAKAQLSFWSPDENEIRKSVASEVNAAAVFAEDDGDDDEAKIWTLMGALANDEVRLLRYTEEGEGFCPVCKRGKLQSWFY